MDMKMLALDMDGTTLNSDHVTLSPANRKALEKVVSKGILVVTATGRMIGRIPEAILQIKGLRYFVTSNGAAVIDRDANRLLYSNPLSADTVLHILDILKDLPVYIEVYCNGKSYVGKCHLPLFEQFPFSSGRKEMMKMNRSPVDDLHIFLSTPGLLLEKINMPYLPDEFQDEVWARLRRVGGIALTSSVPKNCEVNHSSANKADGLLHLCRHLGIAPEQVMAMGDNGNDLEMIQMAGLSVAPANANEEIKAAAGYLTASNDDDGVAKAIHRFLL